MRQQDLSNTPYEERDQMQTPDFVFWWINQQYEFDIDLAATRENRKVPHFLDKEADALNTNWGMNNLNKIGFCNPPYSMKENACHPTKCTKKVCKTRGYHLTEDKPGLEAWFKKAYKDTIRGLTTVLLVHTPNGEDHYRDVFGKATRIIFINGRISHVRPDGTPASGNQRGSCFIVFEPVDNKTIYRMKVETRLESIDRDEMKRQYSKQF